jgi:hypothetical protein
MTKLFRISAAASLGLLLLVTSAAPAHAQSDETATSMARERFKEGVQYFDQKQYDRARVAFLQAYALKRHPAVLLNLAQSELRSGKEADAAKHFSAYLREAKDATAAEREGAEAGLFAAKAVVGEIAVQVDTEGAIVLVDGNEEGAAPLPDAVYLTPGNHTLEARKDGKSSKAQVTAKAGEATEISLRLGGGGLSPTPGDSSAPVDDSRPAEQDSGASGGGKEGFFPWFGHTPLAWVTSGLAVAGVAGGVGFGLSARQSYDDADVVADNIREAAAVDGAPTQGICTDPGEVLGASVGPGRINQYEAECAKHQDNVDKGDQMKTLSIVSWAVAGAAAAGTVIYYFADAEDERGASARRAPRPRVGAIVSPGFVALKGEF